jgi:pseudaminic acid synthase
MNIDGFEILENSPTFIVAELSANHNHDKNIAIETIRAAKKSGADAIKLQTYTPDTITIDCDNDYFRIKGGTLWDNKTLYQLYEEAYTPWEWHIELKQYAEQIGLIFFSTPFDRSATDFLEKINVPCFKIASFEISDIPLIEYVASKGKPVIISTGIATLENIKEALAACHRKGNKEVALLKCTSAYPAPVEEANLLMIPDMAHRFNTVVGLSDHTIGNTVAITAVALGAKIIEKHFILDRKLGGPDAKFSMEPEEFRAMVQSIRIVEKALGMVSYELSEKVKTNRIFARSLFVIKDIVAGEELTKENIRSIRPGNGLPPKFLNKILGKRSTINLSKGTPLSWEHFL